MSATSGEKPYYPDYCPLCQEATGWPFSAGTCHRPGVIVVKLRCRTCEHEWIADAPGPSMKAVTWPWRSDRRRGRQFAIL